MSDAHILTVLLNAVSGVAAILLLIYTNKTGRYELGYSIVVILVFMVFFPVIYFTGGGYYSAMPCFFIFAVVFTGYMLRGHKSIVFVIVETAIYIGCFVLEYIRPEIVIPLESSEAYFFDSLVGFVSVSVVLSIAMFLLLRLYDKQQILLEESRKKAEQVSEIKSNFLANMSHEIRTPINTIMGMNEMILREYKSEEVRNYSIDIKRASDTLFEIINNILDMSKIEAGKMEIENMWYESKELISDIISVGNHLCSQKNLQFNTSISLLIPKIMWGAPMKIKQVLVNLVSNAVKYTKEGSVTFKAEARVTNTSDEIAIIFSVIDTGIGIKSEDMPYVFDSFHRVETLENQKIEGTGLGLSIAKDLTEKMNGHILVESEYGKGSIFRLEVKQKRRSTQVMGEMGLGKTNDYNAGEGFIAPKARLLFVDDHAENLKIARLLLKQTQMKIDTAISGNEAIKKVKEHKYNIIFMDYRMPEKDGIETKREMESLRLIDDIPIVALTADYVEKTRDRLIEEGFSTLLSKPIQNEELESTIKKYLGQELVIIQKKENIRDVYNKPKCLDMELSNRGISLSDGIAFSEGDIEFYRKKIRFFLESGNETLEEMKRMYLSEEYENLKIKIHAIKSGARGIGATDLYDISRRIESKEVKTNSGRRYMKAIFPVFVIECEQAIKEFEALSNAWEAEVPIERIKVDVLNTDSRQALSLAALEAVRVSDWKQSIEEINKLTVIDKRVEARGELNEIVELIENLQMEEAEKKLEEYIDKGEE
ncbi:MAG: ATP-binding protein [Suipraeoptans sp.]